MNRIFLSAAVAALLTGSTSVALAQQHAVQCEIVGAEFERQVMQNQKLRAGINPAARRDLRTLRDAAQTLAAYGQEEACREVAEAIREIVNDPQRARTATTGVAVVETAPATGGATVTAPATATTDTATMDRTPSGTARTGTATGEAIERGSGAVGTRTAPVGTAPLGTEAVQGNYETAIPVNQMTGAIRVDQMIGSDVSGIDDEDIGEISDVVLGPDGQPAYVVISYGGFLGLGEDQTAVPFDMVRVSVGGGTYGNTYYVPITEDRLEEAPRFRRGDTAWFEDETWRTRSAEFYGTAR